MTAWISLRDQQPSTDGRFWSSLVEVTDGYGVALAHLMPADFVYLDDGGDEVSWGEAWVDEAGAEIDMMVTHWRPVTDRSGSP